MFSHLIEQEEFFPANLEQPNYAAFSTISKPGRQEYVTKCVWIQWNMEAGTKLVCWKVVCFVVYTCLLECMQFGLLQSGTSLLKLKDSVLVFSFAYFSVLFRENHSFLWFFQELRCLSVEFLPFLITSWWPGGSWLLVVSVRLTILSHGGAPSHQGKVKAANNKPSSDSLCFYSQLRSLSQFSLRFKSWIWNQPL